MKIVHHLTRNRFVAVGATLLIGLCASSIQAQTSLTPGQFAVNDAGAATYSIPLTVAPGVGGFSPKLTLQYSSQAPNGVFGVGWTLSGVSSITRCAKTPAEDGERTGVKNNATDLFCLDGQKLRAVSGVYGAPGTHYRTAIDMYGRITSQGNVAGGPQFFTLETKTGEIYTFGGAASPGSWLEHPSKGVVRNWMVSEIKDRFNNRISFSYNKNISLGEQLLTQVDYSNGQVKLGYEARPTNDQILKYDDSVQFGSSNSRVSTITVAHLPVVGGTPTASNFKTYLLTYNQSQASQRSILRSLKECRPDGVCLPAVNFTYRDGTPGVFVQGLTNPFQSGGRYGIRDVEGNGKQSVYDFASNSWVSEPRYSNPQLLWDLDGDAKTDILYYAEYCYGEECSVEKVIRYGNGTSTRKPLSGPLPVIGCLADLDGNGTTEEIVVYTRFEGGSNSGRDYYYVKNPFGGTDYKAGFGQTLGACKSIDFNGDGRDELFFDSSTVLSFVNGVWNRLNIASVSQLAGLQGDFNGDGKTDGVGRAFLLSGLKTYLSTGGSAAPVEMWTTSTGGLGCLGDFNGDGRTDALIKGNKLDLSNGRLKTTVSQNAVPLDKGVMACGDFNGDGLMDVAVNGRYWLNTLPMDADRLIEVDNGAGFAQQVEYKSITDATVYTKGSGASYPQIDMQTPIIVVRQIKSSSGVGSVPQLWQTTTYRYAALRADLKRSGTQGFERVISTNVDTGISLATHYNQQFPLTGLRARVHKYLGSDAAPQTLENTTYVYKQLPLETLPSTQAAQVYLEKSVTSFYDLKAPGTLLRSVNENWDVDKYGYPLLYTVQHLDGSGVQTSSSTTRNTYNHIVVGNWLLGQLTSIQTQQQNNR